MAGLPSSSTKSIRTCGICMAWAMAGVASMSMRPARNRPSLARRCGHVARHRRALGCLRRRVEDQHHRGGHRRLEQGLEVLLVDVEGVRRPCGCAVRLRRRGSSGGRLGGALQAGQVDRSRTGERLLRHAAIFPNRREVTNSGSPCIHLRNSVISSLKRRRQVARVRLLRPVAVHDVHRGLLGEAPHATSMPTSVAPVLGVLVLVRPLVGRRPAGLRARRPRRRRGPRTPRETLTRAPPRRTGRFSGSSCAMRMSGISPSSSSSGVLPQPSADGPLLRASSPSSSGSSSPRLSLRLSPSPCGWSSSSTL